MPVCMLAVLACNLWLVAGTPQRTPLYAVLLAGQVLFYALALTGHLLRTSRRCRAW